MPGKSDCALNSCRTQGRPAPTKVLRLDLRLGCDEVCHSTTITFDSAYENCGMAWWRDRRNGRISILRRSPSSFLLSTVPMHLKGAEECGLLQNSCG